MRTDVDLEAECREKFAQFCALYADSPFHIDKRRYHDLAYEQVEIFLDWRDVQRL